MLVSMSMSAHVCICIFAHIHVWIYLHTQLLPTHLVYTHTGLVNTVSSGIDLHAFSFDSPLDPCELCQAMEMMSLQVILRFVLMVGMALSQKKSNQFLLVEQIS